MTQRAHTCSAASLQRDERAQHLGKQVHLGTAALDEAAAKIIAEAVENGVLTLMCRRHHYCLAEMWGSGEVTSAATSMLVSYALGDFGREGHLAVAGFDVVCGGVGMKERVPDRHDGWC